jgi:hypothetical protein
MTPRRTAALAEADTASIAAIMPNPVATETIRCTYPSLSSRDGWSRCSSDAILSG